LEPVVVYSCLQEEMTLDWVSLIIWVTVFIPPFADHLCIQWESNTIAKILICFGFSLLLFYVGIVTVKSKEIFDLVIVIFAIVWALFLVSLAVTSSICIIPKDDTVNPDSVQSPLAVDDGNLTPKMSSDAILRDILKEETSLDSFMLHLAKSYSMEILLSLIEFVQYQQWLDETLNVDPNDVEKKSNRILIDLDLNVHSPEISIEFPSNIIVSEIIENDESELINVHEWSEEMVQIQRTKIKAHRLYEKYISEAKAGYEINISFAERRRLRDLLEDLDALLASDVDVNELNTLFDTCKKTMIQYLRDHCVRFQRSEDRTSTTGTVDHTAIEWMLESRNLAQMAVM